MSYKTTKKIRNSLDLYFQHYKKACDGYNHGMYSTAGYEWRPEVKCGNSSIMSSRESIVFILQWLGTVHNTFQDLIFDSLWKPAVMFFPFFHNDSKCINLNRNITGFVKIPNNYDTKRALMKQTWASGLLLSATRSKTIDFLQLFWLHNV